MSESIQAETCVLVTGGAGFIGSRFVRMLLEETDYSVVVLDALTYAGDRRRLDGLDAGRLTFVGGDICDAELVAELFRTHKFDAVVNFAAESHVDRSIADPSVFVRTNVLGTQVLLDATLDAWRTRGALLVEGASPDASRDDGGVRFIQVSTDEVYGSLGDDEAPPTEESPLRPSSPYSASKAAADLLVQSYGKTYGFPFCITRGSNTYGPGQHPEKFIPHSIEAVLRGEPVSVYGDGRNVRDWLHVDDHCRAILAVLLHGCAGGVYNIGGGHCLSNNEVARCTLELAGAPSGNVRYVADRPGHDLRYAMDCSKIHAELGWLPQVPFEDGLARTFEWCRVLNV